MQALEIIFQTDHATSIHPRSTSQMYLSKPEECSHSVNAENIDQTVFDLCNGNLTLDALHVIFIRIYYDI